MTPPPEIEQENLEILEEYREIEDESLEIEEIEEEICEITEVDRFETSSIDSEAQFFDTSHSTSNLSLVDNAFETSSIASEAMSDDLVVEEMSFEPNVEPQYDQDITPALENEGNREILHENQLNPRKRRNDLSEEPTVSGKKRRTEAVNRTSNGTHLRIVMAVPVHQPIVQPRENDPDVEDISFEPIVEPQNDQEIPPAQQNKKIFKCGFCQKIFSDKTALSRHKKRHTGEKTHICPECTKSFFRKDGLKQHYDRVHLAPPLSPVF